MNFAPASVYSLLVKYDFSPIDFSNRIVCPCVVNFFTTSGVKEVLVSSLICSFIEPIIIKLNLFLNVYRVLSKNICSKKRISMLEYLKIFLMFAKIGLFTFGGGLAMFPMFKKELVEKKGYITEEDLIDYYSIGQCTPGIIAINVATFTGYRIKRTKGAVIATLGVVFPCLVIIIALAGVLSVLADNDAINHAFNGIRIGVTALLVNEMIGIVKKSVTNRMQLIIMVVAFVLVLCFKISSIVAVMLAGIWAIISYLRNKK